MNTNSLGYCIVRQHRFKDEPLLFFADLYKHRCHWSDNIQQVLLFQEFEDVYNIFNGFHYSFFLYDDFVNNNILTHNFKYNDISFRLCNEKLTNDYYLFIHRIYNKT